MWWRSLLNDECKVEAPSYHRRPFLAIYLGSAGKRWSDQVVLLAQLS